MVFISTRVFLLLFAFTAFNGWTCDEFGNTGIVEENDLRIAAWDKANSNSMTKSEFIQIISQIERIYSPIFRSKGKTLVIKKDWEDSVVNAYAKLSGTTAHVVMSGGLARHPVITNDALALVVCHEVGHHIGGAPTKNVRSFGGRSISWASNEGQADYWGSLKCMRRYLSTQDNVSYIDSIKIPTEVKNLCEGSFHDLDSQAICMRTTLAGHSLASMFRAIRTRNGRVMNELSYVNKDPRVVKNMDDAHPAPQCRLDTYFSGSLCDKDIRETVSYTDFNSGVCTQVNGYNAGTRPKCWYRPPNY
ncbi:MAG: M48 family metalloprotease [Bacteriovoracaceae bacterium]